MCCVEYNWTELVYFTAMFFSEVISLFLRGDITCKTCDLDFHISKLVNSVIGLS